MNSSSHPDRNLALELVRVHTPMRVVAIELPCEVLSQRAMIENPLRLLCRRLRLLKRLIDDHDNEADFCIRAKLEPWLLKGF